MVDLRHELCQLGEKINWPGLVEQFAALYAEHGRSGVPIRLMAGLHYLKHAFGFSDEVVVKSWVKNPYWQYFFGEEYFQHRLPIDPSQMTRFRTRLGPRGCEKLLELTIAAGLEARAVKPASFTQVTVDTTVQEKAIAFPTDGRLYHKGRVWLVRLAKRSGIELRQSSPRARTPACHPHAGTVYLGGSPRMAFEVFFGFHRRNIFSRLIQHFTSLSRGTTYDSD